MLSISAATRSSRSAIEKFPLSSYYPGKSGVGGEIYQIDRLRQAKQEFPVKTEELVRRDTFHSQVNVAAFPIRVNA